MQAVDWRAEHRDVTTLERSASQHLERSPLPRTSRGRLAPSESSGSFVHALAYTGRVGHPFSIVIIFLKFYRSKV